MRGRSTKDEYELICPLGQALLCRQLAAGLEIVTIAGVEGDVEFFAERLLQREVIEEYLAFADDLGGAALHHDGRCLIDSEAQLLWVPANDRQQIVLPFSRKQMLVDG